MMRRGAPNVSEAPHSRVKLCTYCTYCTYRSTHHRTRTTLFEKICTLSPKNKHCSHDAMANVYHEKHGLNRRCLVAPELFTVVYYS